MKTLCLKFNASGRFATSHLFDLAATREQASSTCCCCCTVVVAAVLLLLMLLLPCWLCGSCYQPKARACPPQKWRFTMAEIISASESQTGPPSEAIKCFRCCSNGNSNQQQQHQLVADIEVMHEDYLVICSRASLQPQYFGCQQAGSRLPLVAACSCSSASGSDFRCCRLSTAADRVRAAFDDDSRNELTSSTLS